MIELKVEGMSCMHCVKTVAEALAAVQGVEQAPHVSLDPGIARVEGNASAEELIGAVKAAGYDASLKQ
jgi:copper chaperone CopZ